MLLNCRGKCKRFVVDVFVNFNFVDFEVNLLEESVCFFWVYDELFFLVYEFSYLCDVDDDDVVFLGVFVVIVNSLFEVVVVEM